MKNKGFTLVEILGVMTLLAVIFALVYPNVIHMLDQGKQAEYEEYQNDIFLATEAYLNSDVSMSSSLNGVGDEVSIPFVTLLESGFLSSSIVDPRTGHNVVEQANDKRVIVTKVADGTFSYSIDSIAR